MAADLSYRAIYSSHMNPFLSGVAKFNKILAQQLGVGCFGFDEFTKAPEGPALVSVKLGDASPKDVWAIRTFLGFLDEKKIPFDLFFHTYGDIEIEHEFITRANKIYCGNHEIESQLANVGKPVATAWCPGLLDHTTKEFEETLNLFSFGMAHKIQTEYHRKLFNVLREYGVDFRVWVSTAFHEKANFGDFNSIARELSDIYGSRIMFLGFLSDDSINYFLKKADLFIAFFEKGVRANNTSFLAAMERGLPIITNLDNHSAPWLKHGENVIDIQNIKPSNLEPSALQKVGGQAAQDCLKFGSWSALRDFLGKSNS